MGMRALQGVFIQDLSEEIKDELAAIDETDSLETLISLSIRLDNHLRERRESHLRDTHTFPNFLSQQVQPKLFLQLRSVPSPSPPGALEEPMQLGRARLTPAERQRRFKEGLCILCGQKGNLLSSYR